MCWASSATTRSHVTARQQLGVVAHRAVGREHEAVADAGEVAGAAVVAAYGHSRGEPADLRLPVAQQRCRADDEGRARTAVQVQRDQRHRLAQPHVVGEAGTESQRRELGQPGQSLALVVAQGGLQGRGHVDGVAGGRGQHLVADREQAGSDDRFVVDVLDVDDPGQGRGERLDGGDRADQSLAGALDHTGVDRDPVVAQPDDRAGRAGQLVHLLGRELLAVEGELPLEAEQGLGSEEAVLQQLLARIGGTAATELDALGDLAVEVLRPHHRMAGIGQRRRPAVEQREDLVGVEHDLVGDAQVEQAVEHGPRVRGRPQRDRGMGAGAVAEAVARARTALGPERGRVGDVGGVVDGVHLHDQPQRAGDQLLLVGLDAEGDGHQVRQVVAPPGTEPGDALLEVVAEVVGSGRRRSRGGREPPRAAGSGAGHRVGDRVKEGAHRPFSGGRVEAVVGAGAGQVDDAPLVGRVQAGHLPVTTVGVRREPPGSNELQAQQRTSGEECHRRVEVGLVAHLGQHRQGAADRHHDRAPVVGELDRAVPGEVARQQSGGTGDRDKAHADSLRSVRA